MKRKKPEKVWGFTVASFLGLLGVHVLKYLVDFLLLPKLFPDLYPYSWGALGLWLATTVIVAVASMLWITRFGWFYPIAALLYAIIVAIWPMGLYGMGDLWHPIIGALMSGVIIEIVERVILWIFILVGFMRM